MWGKSFVKAENRYQIKTSRLLITKSMQIYSTFKLSTVQCTVLELYFNTSSHHVVGNEAASVHAAIKLVL